MILKITEKEREKGRRGSGRKREKQKYDRAARGTIEAVTEEQDFGIETQLNIRKLTVNKLHNSLSSDNRSLGKGDDAFKGL